MMESKNVRVFASSHHQIAMLGVRSLIETTQRPIHWLGNEPPSDSILSTLTRKKPNVFIADPVLLNFDFTLPKKLLDMEIGLMIMTPHKDLSQQVSYLKAGAKAVVTWNETPGTFISALEQVAQLQPWFSPELGSKLMHYAIDGETKEHLTHEETKIAKLTLREKNVIVMIIKHPEATVNDLAKFMYLSPATVRNYLSDIYKKLDIKGKAALIAFTHDNQLCHP